MGRQKDKAGGSEESNADIASEQACPCPARSTTSSASACPDPCRGHEGTSLQSIILGHGRLVIRRTTRRRARPHGSATAAGSCR